MSSRPLVPAAPEAGTLHIGTDDLPWLDAGDGSALQLLHVDLDQGLWISNTRLAPGYRVTTHFHTGFVYAVTLQGSWYYLEAPEAVNRPGSYLFEPAGSRHTLVTPKDQSGDTIVWFAIYGANINLDADGNVLSIIDARTALELYRGYCDALDLDCSKLIVKGA
ncbi:MAG: 2,4'-dihydroxyacetophenone dioxygenase family protein [Alphaproteobacteria bacterium]|nr:2,4'-dihydroxyacetophenone dioxygenase family protein [Alphaproteobacteria bacterium]